MREGADSGQDSCLLGLGRSLPPKSSCQKEFEEPGGEVSAEPCSSERGCIATGVASTSREVTSPLFSTCETSRPGSLLPDRHSHCGVRRVKGHHDGWGLEQVMCQELVLGWSREGSGGILLLPPAV